MSTTQSCKPELGSNVASVTNMMKFRGYKIGAKIGEGGHGFVYRIELENPKNHEIMYALKIVDLSNPDEREQFKKEREILKKLTGNGHGVQCIHQNINCYLKISENKDCGYIITELYDGDLFDDLKKNGNFWARFLQDPNPMLSPRANFQYEIYKINLVALELQEEIRKIRDHIENKKMPHTKEMIQNALDKISNLQKQIENLKNGMNNQLEEYSRIGNPVHRDEIIKQYLSWISQIASSIKYLHDRQMAHGDIKPQNILVRNEDGRIVITDFDTLYFLPSKSQLDHKFVLNHKFVPKPVTPIYASPQLDENQARMVPVTLEEVQISDIWALALLILVMWFGENEMFQKLNQTTGSPRTFASAIYRELKDPEKATTIFGNLEQEITRICQSYPKHTKVLEKTLLRSVAILDQINQNKITSERMKEYLDNLSQIN